MIKRNFHLVILIFLTQIIFTTSANALSLIFSEVFYDTPGIDSKEEWIEIYNASTSAINIGGFTIEDNSSVYTIAAGTIINPGKTLIFARSTTGFFNLYGFNPDFGNLNLSLSNSGDFLRLKNTGGVLLDEVAWEGALPGWGSVFANTNKSIKRATLASGPSAWLSNQNPDPGSPAPLPEPTTYLLFAVGLLSILLIKNKV